MENYVNMGEKLNVNISFSGFLDVNVDVDRNDKKEKKSTVFSEVLFLIRLNFAEICSLGERINERTVDFIGRVSHKLCEVERS